MSENNYDFRFRHWDFHKAGRRVPGRKSKKNEVMISEEWAVGCPPDSGFLNAFAASDFRDYLEKSMMLSLRTVHVDGPNVIWIETSTEMDKGFAVEAGKSHIRLTASEKMALRGTIHLEDIMNLEGAPVLPLGKFIRKPLYEVRSVHSGSGLDVFPDSELLALLHAGYDSIHLFCEGIDRNHIGYCDFNDIISRASRFGIQTFFHNYVRTFIHPDDEGAQEKFDAAYGEIFRRYPALTGISLCGESLEFPSKDPATTGKSFLESFVDGIPDSRPSPGWYPCCDYPDYIRRIEQAVHKVKPEALIMFSTYNWGYAPLSVRKKFLKNFPKNVILDVCYEIFSRRKLEGLHTPVMDYTISADRPGYYFTSECSAAHKLGIPLYGNVNTAGIGWDFGCVPLVPAPMKILNRDLNLRKARKLWKVSRHYTTHHYGWWNSVAADLGKWSSWDGFEPDYDGLLKKIAVRDYGRKSARFALDAWKFWNRAMDHYIASNEDQYGPWRVGAAYPFIFQPNISRTMQSKEIAFPTAPHAHFGHAIVKTFYTPYENAGQSPGFLRYPAELRSLRKMLALWNQGLDAASKAVDSAGPEKYDENRRLEALGHFIRNSIITAIHIKEWWRANMAMQNSASADEAEKYLDRIEQLAFDEIRNAQDTIPCVEFDSRLGWEPSMEYVCDKWHLEWKIRQVNSALNEIAAYRKMLHLHRRK